MFFTLTDLYDYVIPSSQIIKKKKKKSVPTFYTKVLFCYHTNSRRHDVSRCINISCHSFSFPSCTPILSPTLPTFTASHLPAFFLFYLESFGITMNKIFISGK